MNENDITNPQTMVTISPSRLTKAPI